MRVVVGSLLLITAPSSSTASDESNLSQVDLSGHWYVLIHYKDDRSEDPSITKFKDLAWSIDQQAIQKTLNLR